jgi:hypothetical protein
MGISFGPMRISGFTAVIEPTGQQAYTTPGTYTWVAPTGVTSVSVVCVGAGGAGNPGYYDGINSYFAGGGGGALAYVNNFTVIPGQGYTVVVPSLNSGANVRDASFNTTTCAAGGGLDSPIGTASGGGGGSVIYGTGYPGGAGGSPGYGNYWGGGGGGAGGYSGAGGNGFGQNSDSVNGAGQAGAGGGGGGGGAGPQGWGFGGGVGILGQGSNGAGGYWTGYVADITNGGGGSGGNKFTSDPFVLNTYGGGMRGGVNGYAIPGAVRIIWPGTSRQFPSTNTQNL